MSQNTILGVDVGGTFTDLVLLEGQTVRLAKVPTTPQDQSIGVLSAIDTAGADLGEVDLIIHGTTATTNALLERRLAKTGLITTAGFRDILELGRRTRPNAYGMTGTFEPVIPRNLRLEVPERMDAQGRIVTPLDETALKAATEAILAEGCEAVIIHFLHAYANPAHERRAGEIVRAIWPNAYVTLGSELISESREFERGVTAAVNGAVQPLIDRYVQNLSAAIASRGYAQDLLVMNGNGGMVSAPNVAREAAKTVMSGPASGVMAASFVGRRAGQPNLLTYDMGGTSTDVALIRDARPGVSNEIEIEYAMPVHVPMVDVRTVGAGGGSIASVDAAGLLKVGPESAGASPGPICFGRGGTQVTISDANMLLGRLNPEALNAVDAKVSLDSLADAFKTQIGDALGLSATDAATAVLTVANTKMAGAIRMVSISLGADPRDFALFAFGGAGPLHASALAKELSIPKVLIPARPGLTNALGCVVADLRHDFVQTFNQPLDTLDLTALHTAAHDHITRGTKAVEAENVTLDRIDIAQSLDMQFQGQTHVLRVPLETPEPTRDTLRELFERHYFDRFQVELADIKPVLVNLNTSVIGVRPEPDLSVLIDAKGRRDSIHAAQTSTRDVQFNGEIHKTPIYVRDDLPADAALQGPAIVEQFDTTIVIEPGDSVTTDPDGNMIIEVRHDD
jgi:N-methylhydantoinase A